MVEENGAIPGLFVNLPGIKEIAHDRDYVPPALNVLVASLRFELESGIAQSRDILLVPQTVTSQARELIQEFLDIGFVVVDPGEVAIPHSQSSVDFGGQDLEFAP